MTIETKKVYISEDGKEFDTFEDCQMYESKNSVEFILSLTLCAPLLKLGSPQTALGASPLLTGANMVVIQRMVTNT